jgi:ppGpp synthetase/RelA/SpoT-type nucleotidyltranferase
MGQEDFEAEKNAFRTFHDANGRVLDDAKNAFLALVRSLVVDTGEVAISKVEGRVKDCEECINKFDLKYRAELEKTGAPYAIKDHVMDLIGLRIVCLYEDDIEKLRDQLARHFEVMEVTNKIASIENTESSFGYKGLHLDLRLGAERRALPEHRAYAGFQFEVQIRTIIQDSWSVLDHKIKYKKSIPNRLKRRINTLAALFELADREFREIRDSTEEELARVASEVAADIAVEEQPEGAVTRAGPGDAVAGRRNVALDAFAFVRIARHFFRTDEFDPQKVDGFTERIVSLDPEITRGKFNTHLKTHITRVKRYQAHFESQGSAARLNPFTLIRHCLYLADRARFSSLLTNAARTNFEAWLTANPLADSASS